MFYAASQLLCNIPQDTKELYSFRRDRVKFSKYTIYSKYVNATINIFQ